MTHYIDRFYYKNTLSAFLSSFKRQSLYFPIEGGSRNDVIKCVYRTFSESWLHASWIEEDKIR